MAAKGGGKKFGKSGGALGGKGLSKAGNMIATGSNVKALGSKKAG
jgi:hypothetical protein